MQNQYSVHWYIGIDELYILQQVLQTTQLYCILTSLCYPKAFWVVFDIAITDHCAYLVVVCCTLLHRSNLHNHCHHRINMSLVCNDQKHTGILDGTNNVYHKNKITLTNHYRTYVIAWYIHNKDDELR